MKKEQKIYIKGARVHNLKNIDVEIPHNKLIVITGLSGSGKSTLAFDTIFAEGQRRYVESLSAYARQFLGRVAKPDVDMITGIAPAIAIQQRVSSRNPRSTIGTSTEIYDYLKLLYSRVGHTFSPITGQEVRRTSADDVADYIVALPERSTALIVIPLPFENSYGIVEHMLGLLSDGFQRVVYRDEVMLIDQFMPLISDDIEPSELFIVADRFKVSRGEEALMRYRDSVTRAFDYGGGNAIVRSEMGIKPFSTNFEVDGITFEEPSEHLFSFNNPLGACPTCEGYGKVVGIDEELVIPDPTKSVYEGAIACWRGETMSKWREQLVTAAHNFDFPLHKPYYELSRKEKQLLWTGNKYFKGLNAFFDYLESKKRKIQYRVMKARYTGKTTCPECGGSRLKREALYVQVGGQTIADLVFCNIDTLAQFFDNLQLDSYDAKSSERILVEIRNRLESLQDVGLGYLTLDRLSSTLSGGESQRINLATSLGSNLTGSLYILDEPSIGLHPRDTERLIKVLKRLRDLGNTVIVVEHEEEIMRAADHIIDIGPRAGYLGGKIVFSGTFEELLASRKSLTAEYLSGRLGINAPTSHRSPSGFITIRGARENNLKGDDLQIPLGVMTCVTGVSGSGKSSLVRGVLYPVLRRELSESAPRPGHYDTLEGDYRKISSVEMVDQNPIGKSSRSNPVTYIKAYDEIRKLFATQPFAQKMGYTPSSFSFNMAGGRCEECQGEGIIKVEMQFMADVELVCEACKGRRFTDEVLEVKYRDKSIFDILEMTIDHAMEFFSQSDGSTEKRIVERIKPLQDVGLGYIKLGQSSSTLSGGESQRVKLASFLSKDAPNSGKILFIFDEPTTGLHFDDINKLMKSLYALLDRGHTIVVVEHNMDVVKCGDWVIDIGAEGGDAGGHIIYSGCPEELTMCAESYTAKYLKENILRDQEQLNVASRAAAAALKASSSKPKAKPKKTTAADTEVTKKPRAKK